MFMVDKSLTIYGFAIWLGATAFLRVIGQHVLRPNNLLGTIIIFAISFPLMAWLTRRLCSRVHLPPDNWPSGAISLALPTLLLDPFSSAFFPVVFPNIAPELAGVFGGWMLWCCAGALIGASNPPGTRA
jgi:hypothetical protein